MRWRRRHRCSISGRWRQSHPGLALHSNAASLTRLVVPPVNRCRARHWRRSVMHCCAVKVRHIPVAGNSGQFSDRHARFEQLFKIESMYAIDPHLALDRSPAHHRPSKNPHSPGWHSLRSRAVGEFFSARRRDKRTKAVSTGSYANRMCPL